jgi:hypothetical protein
MKKCSWQNFGLGVLFRELSLLNGILGRSIFDDDSWQNWLFWMMINGRTGCFG